jgi:hypothetical protein
MKVNDACIVEIYDYLAQDYCCSQLGEAVGSGAYHVVFHYKTHRYALLKGNSDPRWKQHYLYYCPFCGKSIDDDEQENDTPKSS